MRALKSALFLAVPAVLVLLQACGADAADPSSEASGDKTPGANGAPSQPSGKKTGPDSEGTSSGEIPLPGPAAGSPVIDVGDLPALSGDGAQDRILLMAALKEVTEDHDRLRTEYDNFLRTGRNPPPDVVKRYETRTAKLKAREARIQELLDKIR